MIRQYLPYSLSVLKVNFIISPIATFFATMLAISFTGKEITLSGVMYFFTISFLTGGFLLGALFFEFFRSREYYMFYNLGISKLRLILMTYMFHIVIAALIIIIASYAKQI